MANSTDQNYSAFYYDEEVCEHEKQMRSVYLTIVGLMLVVAFYFLLSVIAALKRAPASPGDASCTLRYATVLRSLLVVVIVVINFRTALDIAQLASGTKGNSAFGAIFLSKAVLAVVGNASVYAFLWLRQWVLYDQPMLKKVKTNCFKAFNIFVLVLVVSLVAAGPVVETRYVKLELTRDGCMLVRTNKWGFALGISTAFSILYELILLGFFIYPLKKTHDHAATEDTSSVAPIVKRSLISATACVLNEIVFSIVHNVIERPLMLTTVTTDLKFVVYYLCLVSSYNDWRQKFCFACTKRVRTHSLSKAASFRSKLSSEDLDARHCRTPK